MTMNLMPAIHQRLFDSAKHSPKALAIEFNDQRMTYEQLVTQSTRLSDVINRANDNSSECIAIFMGKCIESVVSIYGILQSGSAYLPLDITNPQSRFNHILQQCKPNIIITSNDYAEALSKLMLTAKYHAKVIILGTTSNPDHKFQDGQATYLDLNNAFISDDEIKLPVNQSYSTEIDSNALAAILYTSGSTGTPKGVLITHAAVCTFIHWALEYFTLEQEDKCISHAPLHFDLSLFDIFATHAAQASLILVPENKSGNPRALSKLIAEKKITVWQSVPSVLVMLYKYGGINQYQFPNLRQVLFAGEVMNTEVMKGLICHFANATFHNIYGATETNDTFIYSIKAGQQVPKHLPIGSPLPYVEYRIINNLGLPVNQGELGELEVKTPTLMRGYKGDPNTIPEYYPTKDLVFMGEDGQLHYAGRTDDIVKSSGYRVNLLEIETALLGHEKISEAAVITQPDMDVGNKIVAVVTRHDNAELSSLQLKVYCSERLPKYAIPHIFEISAAPLPKTPSGKTNRKLIIKSRKHHVEHTHN